MLDTIYIIDEYLAKPKPTGNESPGQNFTMPGRELVGSPLPAEAISIIPPSLLHAAVTNFPSLTSLLSSDKDEDQDGRAQKERMLSAFMDRATFSPTQARDAGYRFQPGHPMTGKSYRRHPLADHASKETQHLYIPSESYDAHVLEERESELIRLLVALGATKISITKMSSDSKGGHIGVGGSVDAGPIAAVKTDFRTNSQQTASTTNTRVFSLTGRPWDASKEFDCSSFFWLAFEPSWKAVLFAREHGGCTEASLELKENTSFSEDRNVELSIKAKKMGGGASAAWGDNANEERMLLIDVLFSPLPSNAH